MTATEWKPSACVLCECNCGIEVQIEGHVEGRRLAKIRPKARADPGDNAT